MEPFHNRMPGILQESANNSWINPNLQNSVYLIGLLHPYAPEEMEAYPVSQILNYPTKDSPTCIQPLKA